PEVWCDGIAHFVIIPAFPAQAIFTYSQMGMGVNDTGEDYHSLCIDYLSSCWNLYTGSHLLNLPIGNEYTASLNYFSCHCVNLSINNRFHILFLLCFLCI